MPTKVDAYSCQYCQKLCRSNAGAILHERSCGRNPSNDYKCFNCKHLKKSDLKTEIYYPAHSEGGDDRCYEQSHLDFHCKLFDLHLKTRKIKAVDEHAHPHELQLMPTTCEGYEFFYGQSESEEME